MIDSIADWFRVANAVLCVLAIILMFVSPAAPWRTSLSTLRMFTAAIAGVFAWQVYTSIEVILERQPDAPAGVRVYGFTIAYSLTVAALLVERRREHRIRRALSLSTPQAVIVTLQPEQGERKGSG